MKLYLVGLSCVGKTTIGKMLSDTLDFSFYDLDVEVEKFYQMPIEVFQEECGSMDQFRLKVSKVLHQLLSMKGNVVIAGTPSGFTDSYLKTYQKFKNKGDLISIYLHDYPENIMKRLTFYDKNSQPIQLKLDARKKKRYLQSIYEDYYYFHGSYLNTDIQIDISELNLPNIPLVIIEKIHLFSWPEMA